MGRRFYWKSSHSSIAIRLPIIRQTLRKIPQKVAKILSSTLSRKPTSKCQIQNAFGIRGQLVASTSYLLGSRLWSEESGHICQDFSIFVEFKGKIVFANWNAWKSHTRKICSLFGFGGSEYCGSSCSEITSFLSSMSIGIFPIF